MTIAEAILYVLVRRNGGLKSDQIADIINKERLFVCKDGRPVSSAFVYRTIKMFPDTFICKNLFSKLFVDGLRLVTKLKSNMKGQITTISDRVLLCKRALRPSRTN